MTVQIFFPRIPSDQDEFLKVVGELCSTHNVKFGKNNEGTTFCIIGLKYADLGGRCANDIIDVLMDKVVGDTTLKPRIYVDKVCQAQFNKPRIVQKDAEEEVVNVTHYFNDFYYVQLRSETEINRVVGRALKMLYDEFRSKKLTLLDYEELAVGRLYASPYRNEDNFFRIKILKNCEGNKIKVNFIDYGNTEYIQEKPVVDISDKLVSIPPLAYRCSIDNVIIVNEKKHDSISREVLNRTYNAKLIKTTSGDGKERLNAIDFLDFASVSYRSYLIVENVAEDVDQLNDDMLESEHSTKQIKTTKYVENGCKDMTEVVLTHMESLDDFYVQLINKTVENDLTAISKKIRALNPKMKDSRHWTSDSVLYLCVFSDDGNWYRSRVLENRLADSTPHFLVQFVDFGNTEKKYSQCDLKPLTADWSEEAVTLAAIPPCAHKCSFSTKMIEGLSRASIGVSHFQDEYIKMEKVVKLTHGSAVNDKVWIVDNLSVDGEHDLLVKYCDQVEAPLVSDRYRLINLESMSSMWFQLVYSSEPEMQRQMTSLKKWTMSRIPVDIKSVTRVCKDKLYCCLNKHGQLLRCRVMGKADSRALIQFIDSGIYDMIKITSLYPLPPSIGSIKPLAKSYSIAMKVHQDKESEVEKMITQIVQHSDVELDLLSESVIKDVLVKKKSLVDSLAEFDSGSSRSEVLTRCQDLPACLLPLVTEEGDVDFSLPSVDKMDEMPLEVAIENLRMRLLRKLFHIDGDCVFDVFVDIVSRCGQLHEIIVCCDQVHCLSSDLALLQADFGDVLADRKSKYRDLQTLIERRTVVANKICSIYASLTRLLDATSVDVLQALLASLGNTLRVVTSLMDILNVSEQKDGSTEDLDVKVIEDQLAALHKSNLYRDVLAQFSEHARATDLSIEKFYAQFHTMCKHYDSNDSLPSVASITVSLIDCTFELHGALKTENKHLLDVIARQDVKETFDVAKLLASCCMYLQRQRSSIETIVSKSAKFESLNEHASSMLSEDHDVFQKIEDGHKRILTSRSALRHAVPDLEDAEELDLKERQQELHVKIHDIRKNLQAELRASRQLIDDDMRKLMLRKPELQLKNQSIFFHNEGIPIFLWDSIYFDMSQESIDSYYNSHFENEKVKIKRIPLSADDYKAVLSNFTVYSSRTTVQCADDNKVCLIPIRYAFLSKCGNIALYLVMPDYVVCSRLSHTLTTSLADIVCFFRDAVNQVVNLWHQGFIYTEDDLKNGLLLETSESQVCLPLALTSIITREKLPRRSEQSINVAMRRLGALFQQTIAECQHLPGATDEALAFLVCVVTNCGDVSEAETVCEDLGQCADRLLLCAGESVLASAMGESVLASATGESMSEADETTSGDEHFSSIEQAQDGGDVEGAEVIAIDERGCDVIEDGCDVTPTSDMCQVVPGTSDCNGANESTKVSDASSGSVDSLDADMTTVCPPQ